MKIQELKEWTYNFWEGSCVATDVVIQPESFKGAVAAFGDRRKKATWIKAFCYFATLGEYYGHREAPAMGLINLLSNRYDHWTEYKDNLLEAFFTLPQGPQYVLAGLQQLKISTGLEEEYYGVSEVVEKAVREQRLSATGSAAQFSLQHGI